MAFIVYISLTSSGFKPPYFFFTLWLTSGVRRRHFPDTFSSEQGACRCCGLSLTQLLAGRVSQPSSQKGGKTTAAGLCSLFPSVCVVAKLKSDFRMCGFADKYKRYRLHFYHPWTQHHMSSLRISVRLLPRLFSVLCT